MDITPTQTPAGTPRTDALIAEPISNHDGFMLALELARELERELQAERERREKAEHQVAAWNARALVVTERAEAEVERLTEERDKPVLLSEWQKLQALSTAAAGKGEGT